MPRSIPENPAVPAIGRPERVRSRRIGVRDIRWKKICGERLAVNQSFRENWRGSSGSPEEQANTVIIYHSPKFFRVFIRQKNYGFERHNFLGFLQFKFQSRRANGFSRSWTLIFESSSSGPVNNKIHLRACSVLKYPPLPQTLFEPLQFASRATSKRSNDLAKIDDSRNELTSRYIYFIWK